MFGSRRKRILAIRLFEVRTKVQDSDCNPPTILEGAIMWHFIFKAKKYYTAIRMLSDLIECLAKDMETNDLIQSTTASAYKERAEHIRDSIRG